MGKRAGCVAILALAVACSDGAVTSDLPPDGGIGLDARAGDGGSDPVDGAVAPVDGDAPPDDAGLPPLRDDALVPDWAWYEKVQRVIDGTSLSAAFAAEGWTPAAGSEIYAARILEGVGSPSYAFYQVGDGAYSGDYWPASTVKLLAAIAAAELVQTYGFTGAATVTWDSGFGDVLRAIYDRAIRVSSNIDYDRTIRVAGFDWLNATFLAPERGFPHAVIQRSYARVPLRDIPGLTIEEDGRSEYIAARSSTADYGCPPDGNCISLFELGEGARRILLHDEIPEHERFLVDPSDVAGITDALCGATPSFFAAGAQRAFGAPATICHKPGWVPDLDCLDHGVITDPTTGARYLLAASTPETTGTSTCTPLSAIAEHVLRALASPEVSRELQHDGGIPIVAQLDDEGTDAEMRRAYTIHVDAPGADRVEIFTDGWPIADVAGTGRFVASYAFMGGGERLLAVRAWSGTTAIGYRSMRVMIAAP